MSRPRRLRRGASPRLARRDATPRAALQPAPDVQLCQLQGNLAENLDNGHFAKGANSRTMDQVVRAETSVSATESMLGMSWVHFLNDGAANYLPGVLPAVLVSLHLRVSMAGLLVAALFVGQATQPFLGWAADRLGGRSLIVAGLLASAVGGGLIGMAHATWILILLLLLIGVGSSLFHPQAAAATRSTAAARQGFLLAVFLVGGQLGRAVWPTVASVIDANLGLPSLWILTIPALITAPLVLRWAPKLPPRPASGTPIRWRKHLLPATLLTVYTSVGAFATFGILTFVPIMWHVRGGTLVGGASIITTMLLVGVIGNFAGGYLTDRLGRLPILLVSCIAPAILTVPLAYVTGFWLWVLAGSLGIVMFLSSSATVLIGQDIFRENPSFGSGIALGLANGIGAVLVLCIGFLVSEKDMVTVFWIFGIALLLSALAALAIPRPFLHHPQTRD